MRILFYAVLVALLSGCADSPRDRNLYEGLRMENARRHYEPGRDVDRDPPATSYEAYERERQRLKEKSPQ